jgi:nucleoside-diphosphate-sugar epimerase
MKLRFAGQNQCFDISKAETKLGYQHKIQFDQAIQKAVK